MISGTLFISGKDKISIELEHKGTPENVELRFLDVCHIIPCNTEHHEELTWQLKHKKINGKKACFLVIAWHITGGVREIEWRASY